MKGNNEWSNLKNSTKQGPRPVLKLLDPSLVPMIHRHLVFSNCMQVILALWFFGCIAQLSPLYLSFIRKLIFWFVAVWWFRCPQSSFQWRGSDIVLSRTKGSHPETHTWEFDTTQGNNAQVRPFSFQIKWSWTIWTAMETTLLTLCCITLTDSAAATCPLDIMHVLVSLSFFDASHPLCLLMFFQILNMVGSKVRPSSAAKTHLFYLYCFFFLFSLLNAYY